MKVLRSLEEPRKEGFPCVVSSFLDCYFSLFIQLCLFTVLETDDVGICYSSGYTLVGLVDFFFFWWELYVPQAIRLIPSSTQWHTKKGYANVWGKAAVSANGESFSPPMEEPICLVWNTKIAPTTTGMKPVSSFHFALHFCFLLQFVSKYPGVFNGPIARCFHCVGCTDWKVFPSPFRMKLVLLVVSPPPPFHPMSHSHNKREFLPSLVHQVLPSPSERRLVVDMLIDEGKKVSEGIHHHETPLQSWFQQNNVYNGIKIKMIYFCWTRWNRNSALVLWETKKQ